MALQREAPARAASDIPWILFELNTRLFAIAAGDVRHMVVMPEVTAVPNLPHCLRGVITVRGRVIPLVDLRLRAGMTSVKSTLEDFCKLMDAREQDHRKWLDELRRSIAEGRAFTLATDPHKCAFGKWYDCYQSQDPWIAGLLKKFDEPHKSIHALAAQVKDAQDKGNTAAATHLVDGTGAAILSVMVGLFDELRTTVLGRSREIVLILTASNKLVAAVVDSAVAIEKLNVEDLPAGTASGRNGLVHRLGTRGKNGQLVLIIEPDRILDSESSDAITALATSFFPAA